MAARAQRHPGPAEPNWLDRAIAYVAPRAAARRAMSRQHLALMSGGYTGARRDRAATADWMLPAGGPETAVIADLPTLRERCADLERNAPVAATIINTEAENVVGTGLALTPQIDATFLRLSPEKAATWQADTRRRFRTWCESVDCDVERKLNFYGLQDLALRGALTRGDSFCLTPMVQRAGRKRLALQLLEADRVSNPNRSGNTATLTEGIEHDPATGEPLRAHISNRHPGDLGGPALQWQAVEFRSGSNDRRNLLHIVKATRIGVRRGVPVLAPVIEPIRQVTRYTEAELQAAVISGLYAVFFRMDPDAFADLFSEEGKANYMARADKWSGRVESGQAINLLPGEEPVTFNPGRPNEQFDPFLDACFTQIGMAVGLPREVLTMRFNASYSAAKGALMMAVRLFMNRRSWLAATMCQPIYELWLDYEVAEGRISAPGYFADEVVRAAWRGAEWVGDGFGSLDPQKDVAAAKGRVELGISTRQRESLLHDGVDYETKHAQLIKEESARRRDGLALDPAAQQAPQPTPAPRPGGAAAQANDYPEQEAA